MRPSRGARKDARASLRRPLAARGLGFVIPQCGLWTRSRPVDGRFPLPAGRPSVPGMTASVIIVLQASWLVLVAWLLGLYVVTLLSRRDRGRIVQRRWVCYASLRADD